MRNRSSDAFKANLLGDFDRAGHLYQASGQPKKAIRCFLKARNLRAAATVEASIGLIAEAAKHLVEGESFLEAADLLAEHRQFAKAARLYARGGNLIMAANTARRTGDPALAAGFEEEAGRYYEAALLWRESGKRDKVLLNFERALQQMPVKGIVNPWDLDEWQERKGSIAGVFAECRAFARAAAVYEEMGYHEPAARCFERAGLFLQAVTHYRAINDLDKVDELVGRIHRIPPDVQAEVLARQGDLVRAAEAYAGAGAPQKAAALLEEARDYLGAARMWDEAREWEKAGNAHFKGGAFADAGASFKKAQLWALAADAYEQAQDFAAALRMAYDGGDWNRAYDLARAPDDRENLVRLWQGIPPTSPQFPMARLMLARAFLDLGRPLLARECLRNLPPNAGGERPWGPYLRGRVSEALGETSEAAQYYREVLSRDLDFLDAGSRPGAGGAPDTPPHAVGHEPAPGELCAERYLVIEPLLPDKGYPRCKGRDQLLEEDVLLEWIGWDAELSASQKRELATRMRALSPLKSPGVLPVLDLIRHGNGWVLVQSCPLGAGLAEWVQASQESGTCLADRIRLCAEVAAALQSAHEAGVYHGSLRPEDVTVGPDGTPKVRGFVRQGPAPSGATEVGPTQDIEALGLLVWYVLTGERASNGPEVPLREAVSRYNLPQELVVLLAGCFADPSAERVEALEPVASALRKAALDLSA